MKLDFHPVADAFRLLVEDELQSLADDIGKRGLQSPIVLLEGKILDGRNRYTACRMAKVVPTTVDYDGETDLDSLVAFVRAANELRRHDTPSQRAMAGAKLRELFEADAKARSKKNLKIGEESPMGPNEPVGRSAAKAAAATGSSESNVKRASTVLKSAPPEVVAAVERGEISVSAAAEKVKAKSQPKADEPPALREAFLHKQDYLDAMQTCRDLQAALKKLAELSPFLHLQSANADANNVKQAIKFSMPYAVCPYCKGKKCQACRQTGWVTKQVYESAPEEKK